MFAAAYFFASLQRVSLAVSSVYVARDLSLSAVGLGLVSSAYFAAYACAQPAVGMLSDRLGPHVITPALLLLAAGGSLVFASAQGLPVALLGRMMVGLGLSGAFVPGMKAISDAYPPRHFARVNGIFFSIGNLGALVGTVPLAYMLSSIGWRGSFAVMGLSALALAGLCWVIMARCGAGPRLLDRAPATGCTKRPFPFREVTANRSLWLTSVFLCCRYGSQMAFQSLWGVPYLVHLYGLPVGRAASVVMMIAVGHIIGAPILGLVSDRALGQRKPVLTAAALVQVLTWAPLVLLPGRLAPWSLYLVILLMGLAGGSTSLAFAMVKESFPLNAAGTAVGLANVATILGGACMPGLVGWLANRAETSGMRAAAVYPYALLPCLVASAVGFVALAFAAENPNKEHRRARTEQ